MARRYVDLESIKRDLRDVFADEAHEVSVDREVLDADERRHVMAPLVTNGEAGTHGVEAGEQADMKVGKFDLSV
jgi:hypothetical protein